jgi:transposase
MTPRAEEFEPIEPVRKKRKKRKKRRRKKVRLPASLKQVNLDAAGIDIGASEHYVAVPEDRDEQPVRCFTTFTMDLYAIADWLTSCGIETIAMESTGVYWIPLMEVLEERGFEVLLVDPHKLKNVSGRKTDVLDCQWIQQLHTYGLLSGAFRPADEVCALRSYVRQRAMLIRRAADHVQHIQKALTQMNVKLKQVLSDVTGKTGMRIIRAILEGERNPATLAAFRDGRCRKDEATIAKALEGTWRREHLFALRQAVELYDIFQEKIADCDRELEAHLGTFPDAQEGLAPLGKKPKSQASHPLAFDGYSELYRIAGVDLTEVPGLDAPTVLTIVSEIGLDMTRWRHDKAFASWLSLCPGSKISGGKRLSSRSRASANRAAAAFRLAAYGLQHSKSYLGAYCRRMKARMGPAKAITATAHKLARIVYAMLLTRTPYVEKGVDFYEQEYQRRRVARLKRNARDLGFQLIPITAETAAADHAAAVAAA